MRHAIAFLVTPPSAPATTHNDNHERLPRWFFAAGWQVAVAAHNDVHLRADKVYIGATCATVYDLIWPIGLGPRESFLDRLQLLQQLPQDRLITAANAYLSLHGKSAWLRYAPPTIVTARLPTMRAFMHEHGGEWVLKPVAGSHAEEVHHIASVNALERIVPTRSGAYWILQRYLDEIVRGEIRTLVCGAQVIGSYLRTPGDNGYANLAAGGVASAVQLDGPAQDLVERVHQKLLVQQVGFAAIDTVGKYLMEVNLANPGGLQTLEEIYAADFSSVVVEAVARRIAARVVSDN